MELLYQDNRILVCLKPVGVLSTDEPGGLPSLLRQQLGEPQGCFRTVHRLDQVVGGVMVLARSRAAASLLGKQVQSGGLGKEYLAVLHGTPNREGTLVDHLLRDGERHLTRAVPPDTPGAKRAELDYRLLGEAEGLSLVRIRLRTGRTHQIRAQFSARGLPLEGDRKYGAPEEGRTPALWSCRLSLTHPQTGEPMTFYHRPPEEWPWSLFPAEAYKEICEPYEK